MSVISQTELKAVPEVTRDAAQSRTRWLSGLTIITGIGVVIGLFLALAYAGTDTQQGDVQRIFYIHMPAFIGGFVALVGTVVGGVMYLRTRQTKWDNLALAGVEVGLALSCVNLVTGMIWSRPIWNTWWTWDPRLTLEAIMLLIYAAYLMLRNAIENPETRRRFASVYGILAIISAIMVIVVIRIRPDTIHPTVIGPSSANAQGAFEIASARMGMTLGINMLVWGILVPVTLVWHSIRLHTLRERVEQARVALLDR
jgi:heme exporter protein C